MRWYVDISPIGKSASGKVERYCVAADQWQSALQRTRELRGESSAFSDFSIELLDGGYRAIDPSSRTRYDVLKAADDAPLSDDPVLVRGDEELPSSGAKSSPGSKPRASSRRRAARSIPADPTPKRDEPTKPSESASTKATAPSNGKGDKKDEAPPSTGRAATIPRAPASAPVVHEAEPATPLPPYKELYRRADDPTPSSPLTYREVALAVVDEVELSDLVELGRVEFEKIRKGLDGRGAPRVGRFIQLAIFDYVFEGKPSRPPVVVYSFKDWRSSEPDVRFPLRDGPSARMSLPPDEGGAMSVRGAALSIRMPDPAPAAEATTPTEEAAPGSSRVSSPRLL